MWNVMHQQYFCSVCNHCVFAALQVSKTEYRHRQQRWQVGRQLLILVHLPKSQERMQSQQCMLRPRLMGRRCRLS